MRSIWITDAITLTPFGGLNALWESIMKGRSAIQPVQRFAADTYGANIASCIDDLVPDDVSQQMTRSSADEEGDTVTGLLRARFAPHERSQNLHVAICPPMRHRPKVTVTQLSGPRSRIKTGDVQPHGIRFDLRLSSASELEQDVLLHFEACCGKPEPTGVGGSHLR